VKLMKMSPLSMCDIETKGGSRLTCANSRPPALLSLRLAGVADAKPLLGCASSSQRGDPSASREARFCQQLGS
jgi:hypothetical protein